MSIEALGCVQPSEALAFEREDFKVPARLPIKAAAPILCAGVTVRVAPR